MMTLQAYNVYTQYQRTELNYEARLTAVGDEQKLLENNAKELETQENSNVPVIYTNEADLSNIQNLRKHIIENILGAFNGNEKSALFPNEDLNINKESSGAKNPYASQDLPSAFLYAQSSEYYEKTSIEFNGQIKIKTPEGEYNLELKFSYTKEFYEKNETQIAMNHEKFKNPFEINLDEDNESLKDLKAIHLLFDVNKKEDDDKKDIFEQLKEALAQRNKAIIEMLNKDLEENKNKEIKPIDNFQLYMENSKEQMDLIAIQKDGLGIFVASANSESSSVSLNVNDNGYSFSASYSSSQTTYAQISSDIKA